MTAEFTVVALTMVEQGGSQLRLQPIGEPGFHLVELFEGLDEETLGDVGVELQEGARYVPRPGDTVRLKITKVFGPRNGDGE